VDVVQQHFTMEDLIASAAKALAAIRSTARSFALVLAVAGVVRFFQ
jgi:hypothetical protein